MEFLDIPLDSEQRLAIVGLDKDIYEYLGLLNAARKVTNSTSVEDERWCGNIAGLSGHAARPFDVQPEPFDRSYLQDLLLEGLESIKGCWSVYWDSESRLRYPDELENDGFRVVVKYRTIQFMVRPPRERDRTKPWNDTNNVRRLHIGAGDIKACIHDVLNLHSNEKISAAIGRGLAIHPDDRADPRIPRIPFEWKIDRQSPEYLDQRAHRWRVTACGGFQKYKKLKAQYERFQLRTGPKDELPPLGQKPRVSSRMSRQRRNDISNPRLEPVQSQMPLIRDPRPGNRFTGVETTLFNVTREVPGTSVALPGSTFGTPAPAYREQNQGYVQPGQFQLDWGGDRGGAPSSTGYGNETTESALDHSWGQSIAAESIPTVWNVSGPQQAAPQSAGLSQPQCVPSPQATHVSRPWASLSPYEQLQNKAFGSALIQTEESQRELVEADQRRIQAEKDKDEAERRALDAAQRRLVEAEQRRAQEERRRREVEQGRRDEDPLRPFRGPFPSPVAPRGGERGLGGLRGAFGSTPQAPGGGQGGCQSGPQRQNGYIWGPGNQGQSGLRG